MDASVQAVVGNEEVKFQIDSLLDNCYFGESKKCALNWAKRVGIIK